MVLCWSRTWIYCEFLECVRLFAFKAFMETCLFLVLGQPDGLDLRNNGSEQGTIVEEVSEPGVTALYVSRCLQHKTSINIFHNLFRPFL